MTTPLLSDLCAEGESAPCHLLLVVPVKFFILSHSEIVLPVPRHPWNKAKAQWLLQECRESEHTPLEPEKKSESKETYLSKLYSSVTDRKK